METFNGDIDGPENLLLLCGKHHRPVDRHESVYLVDELLEWKAQQRANAGTGTPLSDTEAKFFTRLSQEERTALASIARVAQRVIDTCVRAQDAIDVVRAEAESARLKAFRAMGPVQEIGDDGNPTPMSDKNFRLAPVEVQNWNRQVQQAWSNEQPKVVEAQGALSEEIAVLRVMAASLAESAERVSRSANSDSVGNRTALEASVVTLNHDIASLWRIATGEADTGQLTVEPNVCLV